jgi:hypothetical protein
VRPPLPKRAPPQQALLALQQMAGNAAVSGAIRAATLDVGPEPEPTAAEAPRDATVEPSSTADPEVLAEAAAQADLLEQATAAATAQVTATTGAQKAAVNSVFAAQRAQATAARGAHAAAVASSTAAQRRRASAEATASTAAIRTEATAASEATDQAVDSQGAQVDASGAAEAARARQSGAGVAEQARPAGRSGDADIAANQQKVADAAERKAATELPAAANRTATAVQGHAARMRSEVIEPTRRRARDQIRELSTGSETAVADGARLATQEIGQLGAQATQAATSAHQVVSTALSHGQQTAHADLDTWQQQSLTRLRETAGRWRATLVAHGTALATRVGALRRRRTGPPEGALAALRETGTAAVASLSETAEGLGAGSSDLAGAHAQAVAAVGSQTAQGYQQAATAAGAAATQAATAFGQHATSVRAAASAELQQAPQRTSAGLQPHVAKGTADLAATVDEAGETQRSWTADARSRAETGTARVASEAESLAAQHQGEQVQRLFDSFIASMRSWLKDKLGDVAGGIISGIILSIPAILIAVVLLASGPVGWGVLAALIAVGIGFGIYSRFTEYAADHGGEGPGWAAGTGLVVLGILDITGIPYIVEALVGQRAFSPKPMSTFERWERGTQGVINLALMVVGGGKKLFGAGDVHPTVPVEPHGPVPVDPHSPVPVDPHGPAPVDPHAPAVDPNAPRPRDCFVPGTLVRTPTGRVPIETLVVGDVVCTADPGEGVPPAGGHDGQEGAVVAVHATEVDRVLDLVLDACVIGVSSSHPFWCVGSGWVEAGDLRPGQQLLSADTGPVVLRRVEARPTARYPVHNLTVSQTHTYLVSPVGIVVHNKGAAADPIGAIRGRAAALSDRVRAALRSAEAQPAETPGRDARISRLKDLQKSVDQLQNDSNHPDPDVADLDGWADDLDNQLHPIEQELPQPQPVDPTPTQSLTASDALANLQRRRLWNEITGDHPNRSWSAELGERMTSDTPTQVKQKLVLTGRRDGQPPVRVEVSVIYDRTTGTFEDMHLSSGRSPRQ